MGNLAKLDGQDITLTGTAVASDALSGKTFFAGSQSEITGSLATVAIVANNNAYPAGYHAGNGGGLNSVDTTLSAGNIKSGVTILGTAGSYSPTLTVGTVNGNTTGGHSSSSYTNLSTSYGQGHERNLGFIGLTAVAIIGGAACFVANGSGSKFGTARLLRDGVEQITKSTSDMSSPTRYQHVAMVDARNQTDNTFIVHRIEMKKNNSNTLSYHTENAIRTVAGTEMEHVL